MKAITTLLIFQFVALSAVAQTGPRITFDSITLDCGKISEGPPYKFYHKYKNTGDKPLILYSVRGSGPYYCSSWSREPLLPGDSAIITGYYATEERVGAFTKTLSIISNDTTNEYTVVRVKGQVMPNSNHLSYRFYPDMNLVSLSTYGEPEVGIKNNKEFVLLLTNIDTTTLSISINEISYLNHDSYNIYFLEDSNQIAKAFASTLPKRFEETHQHKQLQAGESALLYIKLKPAEIEYGHRVKLSINNMTARIRFDKWQ